MSGYMKRLLRENGLSLVLFILFLSTWLFGQTIAGHRESNKERQLHGLPTETLREYMMGSHFLEATAENWESEFLQMGVYVALTVFLFQKGSSESKSLDQPEEAPWPVRRGGWPLALYQHSLTIAFLILFLISFAIHVISGCANYNEELAMHGQQGVACMDYLRSSRFWFESLQNWQSEFLAIFSMVVLSIFLRQKGSPESKPVDAAHWETGE
jgi:predicted neutral ceramidase superfamily lipid hydrolase